MFDAPGKLPTSEDVYTLVVEDDEDMAETAVELLESYGDNIDAEYVLKPEDAVDEIREGDVSALVADYHFHGTDIDGMELVDEANSNLNIPTVLYTARGSEQLAAEASRKGADYFIKGEDDVFESMAQRIEEGACRRGSVEELMIFKQAADNAGYGIEIVEEGGDVLYINQAFEEMTGYSEDEVVGDSIHDIISAEHEHEMQEILDTIYDGDVWEGCMEAETSSGDIIYLDQTVAPVIGDSDEIEYFIAINRDATSDVEEDRRREMLNGLLRHDVSNHLTSAMGFLDVVMREGDLEEDDLEQLETVMNGIEESTKLVRGVRDILSSDSQDIESVEIDVRELLEEKVDEYASRAERKGKEIEFEEEPVEVKAQAGPLAGEVFSNTIENAIHHADEAERIEIQMQELEDSIEVRIADDGDGLPGDFSWEKGKRGSDSDGTGMGSWLIKEVANAYDAEVEAGESQYGGAEFRFRFERA